MLQAFAVQPVTEQSQGDNQQSSRQQTAQKPVLFYFQRLLTGGQLRSLCREFLLLLAQLPAGGCQQIVQIVGPPAQRPGLLTAFPQSLLQGLSQFAPRCKLLCLLLSRSLFEVGEPLFQPLGLFLQPAVFRSQAAALVDEFFFGGLQQAAQVIDLLFQCLPGVPDLAQSLLRRLAEFIESLQVFRPGRCRCLFYLRQAPLQMLRLFRQSGVFLGKSRILLGQFPFGGDQQATQVIDLCFQ